MSKGRRYEDKPKLNMKKVFAVALAAIVIIMSIIMLSRILTKDNEKTKITSKEYVIVFHDNKWGVIDTQAKEVIPPSYEEMITIPNSKKDVFLCIYDVNYETGEYKTKALNSKNEEIFTQYNQIEAISNQDQSNNILYEENILKVQKDGKFGLISIDRKRISTM